MSSIPDPRPDAVAELVRVLRDQVSYHARHIADLESRLTAANERIADQQRLLARLMEKEAPGEPPPDQPPNPQPVELQRAAPAGRLPRTGRPQNPRNPHPAKAAESTAVREAEAIVREAAQAAVAERRDTGRRPAPRSAPIKVPAGKKEIPHIDAIAGAVFMARDVSRESDRRSVARPSQPRLLQTPQTPIAGHKPTRGIVRSAAALAGGVNVHLVDITLTLNREELRRGHAQLNGRKWWFPFGRR